MMLLVVIACLLLLSGLLLLRRGHDGAPGMGLPEGEVLALDHTGQSMPTAMLRSERLGIQGRPDCLIRTPEGIVPVELKRKAHPPARGAVYPNHLVQVLAYALLVMEHYQEHVPYCLVVYGDSPARKVLMTEENLRWVFSVIEEVRSSREAGEPARSHHQAGRCAGCGVRERCTQSLAG